MKNISELDYAKQEDLLKLQNKILESVALGEDTDKILEALCLAAEELVDNSVSSVMILNEARQSLSVRSAPSVPLGAIQKLNGLVPAANAGSCGTTVFLDQPTYVSNTRTDSRWTAFGQFIVDFDINACWSHPIRTDKKQVIGSFALSSFEPRPPNEFQKNLLSVCANLAGIVLHRERQEQTLWLLSHHDSLTGIPNRMLFELRLEHGIEQAKQHNKQLALLQVDIDNFEEINECWGHHAGDEILLASADLLQACLHPDDTLARHSGDKFMIMLEDIGDSMDIASIAENISAAFSTPLSTNIPELIVHVSIGISVFPNDATDKQTMLRCANTALYKAKASGRNCTIFYEPSLSGVIQDRISLKSQLRRALRKREFILHYQPQFSASDNQVISAEALVRWNHPERGILPPADFIEVAEQAGLIHELGLQVLEQACIQGKIWLDNGSKIKNIAVNLSTKQIKQGCHQDIFAILEKTGFPAENLELEITESLLMEQADVAKTELTIMRDKGIVISLDDFGTGYSSLSQLRDLPIHRMKIDRSFVSHVSHHPGDANNSVLVKTMIAMGHSLGLTIVAEGVETVEQKEILANEGCDIFQGYLLSQPIPPEQMDAFLKTSEASLDTH